MEDFFSLDNVMKRIIYFKDFIKVTNNSQMTLHSMYLAIPHEDQLLNMIFLKPKKIDGKLVSTEERAKEIIEKYEQEQKAKKELLQKMKEEAEAKKAERELK